MLVRDGHGKYIIDGNEIDLRKGQIVFLGGGSYYIGTQDLSNPLKIIPVRFGFYVNDTDQQEKHLSDSLYYSFNTNNVNEYEFLFKEIVRLHEEEPDNYKLSSLTSLLHTILCKSLHELSMLPVTNNSIIKIGEWLKSHPLNREKIDSLARKAKLSRKYFTRKFTSHYGMSPKSYQVLQRLNYAKYLLQETNLSIKEVAEQLDYKDQYVFSKQFKAVIGCSPSLLKKS